ncbi:MAG: hypothetical protein ACJ789_00095 [Thermomicrobiales bacterium]
MSETEWVLFLLFVVLYAIFAAWLGRYSITLPMVMVFASAAIGPGALHLMDIPVTTSEVEFVTEITLGLLLFADASTLASARCGGTPVFRRACWQSGCR